MVKNQTNKQSLKKLGIISALKRCYEMVREVVKNLMPNIVIECLGCRYEINSGGPKLKLENNLHMLLEILRGVSSVKQAVNKLSKIKGVVYSPFQVEIHNQQI